MAAAGSLGEAKGSMAGLWGQRGKWEKEEEETERDPGAFSPSLFRSWRGRSRWAKGSIDPWHSEQGSPLMSVDPRPLTAFFLGAGLSLTQPRVALEHWGSDSQWPLASSGGAGWSCPAALPEAGQEGLWEAGVAEGEPWAEQLGRGWGAGGWGTGSSDKEAVDGTRRYQLLPSRSPVMAFASLPGERMSDGEAACGRLCQHRYVATGPRWD